MSTQNKAMTPIVMRQDQGLSRGSTALIVLLIWLAGLAASTQGLAFMLDYHPALGPHWNHVYWPLGGMVEYASSPDYGRRITWAHAELVVAPLAYSAQGAGGQFGSGQ